MRAALLVLPALVLPAPAAPAPARPLWLSVVPTAPGRVYGVGAAALAGDDAAALRQASDNARADVITRLRADVKADTRVTTTMQESKSTAGPASATRTQETQVGTVVQAQAAELPGLSVDETYLDKAGGTLYALAYLDVAVARRELGARLDAVKADLAVVRGPEPRARFAEARALRKDHADLEKLEDLAGLLGGAGADAGPFGPTANGAGDLRADVARTRLETERRLTAVRAAITFGFAKSDVEVDPDVRDAVRTAVLNQGLGWSDQAPMFALTLRVRGAKAQAQLGRSWWDYSRSADFIMAQGALSLTLADQAGQQYETANLVAKGVGVTEFQADQLLLADYRNKLARTVSAWLADLGK